MLIHFLGTCAGTEPMPDRHHSSMVLESNERLYWFDAGEGCSYTAHNKGLDLLKTDSIFISHPHIDHVGGLPNLLWTILKLLTLKKNVTKYKGNNIYFPNVECWQNMKNYLSDMLIELKYPVHVHQVEEGKLFDDGNISVEAFSNTHIRVPQDSKPLSYSYLIEGEGKKIVYSGDVGNYSELDVLLEDGCDVLIIETGHFGIDDVYEYLKDKNVKKIFFTHNGREILNNPTKSQEKIEKYFKGIAVICEDGLTVKI